MVWRTAASSSYSVKEIVIVFSSETTSPIDLTKFMQLPYDEAYKLEQNFVDPEPNPDSGMV